MSCFLQEPQSRLLQALKTYGYLFNNPRPLSLINNPLNEIDAQSLCSIKGAVLGKNQPTGFPRTLNETTRPQRDTKHKARHPERCPRRGKPPRAGVHKVCAGAEDAAMGKG